MPINLLLEIKVITEYTERYKIAMITSSNIQDYLILELVIIAILYLSVYSVITLISKSKFIGISATIFFFANYVSSYYLLAEGNYQRFVQRVPNFIPAIFSFYYLFK